MMTNRYERKALASLERRIAYLAQQESAPSVSEQARQWIKAELAALNWAMPILREYADRNER